MPGVYSSADAAIKDLQTTTTIAGHPLAEPKAIWIALWDNAADLDQVGGRSPSRAGRIQFAMTGAGS
jgi:hypothetical protein